MNNQIFKFILDFYGSIKTTKIKEIIVLFSGVLFIGIALTLYLINIKLLDTTAVATVGNFILIASTFKFLINKFYYFFIIFSILLIRISIIICTIYYSIQIYFIINNLSSEASNNIFSFISALARGNINKRYKPRKEKYKDLGFLYNFLFYLRTNHIIKYNYQKKILYILIKYFIYLSIIILLINFILNLFIFNIKYITVFHFKDYIEIMNLLILNFQNELYFNSVEVGNNLIEINHIDKFNHINYSTKNNELTLYNNNNKNKMDMITPNQLAPAKTLVKLNTTKPTGLIEEALALAIKKLSKSVSIAPIKRSTATQFYLKIRTLDFTPKMK